jgi:hypothetical protein
MSGLRHAFWSAVSRALDHIIVTGQQPSAVRIFATRKNIVTEYTFTSKVVAIK